MDPKFVIDLKGRSYPMYAGILAEAHALGLTSILTEVIQIPTDANGQTAIVSATVLMGDGKTFQGIGDASPRNVARHLTEAVLRLAETRAKGRALRDACNIGQTMLEELPDLEGEAAPAPSGNGRARAAEAMARSEQPMPVDRPAACEECGVVLKAGQIEVSQAKFGGRMLCPTHQKEAAK